MPTPEQQMAYRLSEMERRLTEIEVKLGPQRDWEELQRVARSFDADGRFGRVLEIDNSGVTRSNTTDESNLYSVTIPGGTLGEDGLVEVDFIGNVRNSTGVAATVSLIIEYGGTVMWRGDVSVPNVLVHSRGLFIHALLVASGSLTSQELGAFIAIGSALTTTTGFGALTFFDSTLEEPTTQAVQRVNGTAAVDSTVDQNFRIRVDFNTASSVLLAGRQMAVTKVY